MQHPKTNIYQSGFNLIELLVFIAILTIIAGAAIPSFASLISRNQVVVQSNTLLGSLHLARSYAITQQKNVHVCHIDQEDLQACSEARGYNSDWSSGWLVFVDVNNNNDFDNADHLVRSFLSNSQTNIVFNQRGRLRFFPDGSSRSAGFYVCDKQQLNYRHVYLLYSGRARIGAQLNTTQKVRCDEVRS